MQTVGESGRRSAEPEWQFEWQNGLLGPPGHGGVGAQAVPMGPPHQLGAPTISAARELQERAILPALQCAVVQDHRQERYGLRPLRPLRPSDGTKRHS
jgi:hypothetical protein